MNTVAQKQFPVNTYEEWLAKAERAGCDRVSLERILSGYIPVKFDHWDARKRAHYGAIFHVSPQEQHRIQIEIGDDGRPIWGCIDCAERKSNSSYVPRLDVHCPHAIAAGIKAAVNHATGGNVPFEPTPTPEAEAAADLEAQHGKLGGRIERALALVEQGVTEFPHYHTEIDPATGISSCDCPDRAPWVNSGNSIGIMTYHNGKACKHALAQRIALIVNHRWDQVAYRKAADRIERRSRALPATSAGTIEDMLGYDDRPAVTVAEQIAAARAQVPARRSRALPASVDQTGTIEDMLGYDDRPAVTVAEQIAAARAQVPALSFKHNRQFDAPFVGAGRMNGTHRY